MKMFVALLLLSLLLASNALLSSKLHIASRVAVNSLYMSDAQPSTPPAAVTSSIKSQLTIDMKNAMKSKEKERLAAIRAILTVIKQKEVDERVDVDDAMVVALMSKLIKQRKESIKSYSDAGRLDLVEQEQSELTLISAYLPQQMSTEDIAKAVELAIGRLNATTVKDMGKVVAELKSTLAGKADMSEVSLLVKSKLTAK